MCAKNDYIIGIDFGTTNSCSAMFINNNLEKENKQNFLNQQYLNVKDLLVINLMIQEVKFELDNQRLYVKVKPDAKTNKAIYVVKIEKEKHQNLFPRCCFRNN